MIRSRGRAWRTAFAGIALAGCAAFTGDPAAFGNASAAAVEHARRVAVRDHGAELATTYDVVLVVDAGERARAEGDLRDARALLHTLEARLSEWRADSEVTLVNRSAARGPVRISRDLAHILRGSRHVSTVTHGAFDVTWKPLGEFWDEAAGDGVYPTASDLAPVLPRVGYTQLALTDSTVQFLRDGMAIGVAGVATGWIVDAMFELLRNRGHADILINIGGDVRLSGHDETGGARTMRIADPFRPGATAAILETEEAAIATSANVFRRRTVAGRHVGHILDPRTGFPPDWDGAVTVITHDGAMADALSTGFFVLGPEAGMSLARTLSGVEVVYVTRQGVVSTLGAGEPDEHVRMLPSGP